MPEAQSSIVVNVPSKSIYEVALDFENYPEFLPDVKAVKVQKKGKALLVNFEIQVIKRINYTLKVLGTPYKKIVWDLVEGSLFKQNRGYWSFEPQDGKTKVTYRVEIDFGMFVPSLITSKLIGSNLPQMLKRFKDRVELLARQT